MSIDKAKQHAPYRPKCKYYTLGTQTVARPRPNSSFQNCHHEYPLFSPHCCVQTLVNTLLEHQRSKTLLVFHSAASFLKSPPSKRVKITQTFFFSFFLLFYIRRTATFHFLSDTSRVKESGRCMFWDRWLEISRLPLWQRPVRRVSAPSISRPRPVAEAGLNHLPDRHCHLSFGHL